MVYDIEATNDPKRIGEIFMENRLSCKEEFSGGE
jgi:hypothetical protein